MRFLITGDSWSQGEWDGYPDDYRITHLGVHQYLLDDGHEVNNVGQGGYHNLQSLDAVKLFNDEFDHLIFFYTDPLRQATEIEIQAVLPKIIIQMHIRTVIDTLWELQANKKCKITVIGGCAKFTELNAVDYVIPSVSQLLVPSFDDSEYMTSREWEQHFFKHEKNFNLAQKQQWLEAMTKASKKYALWNRHPEYFWPDGLHPNRTGAKVLYQQLKQLWFNESLSLG